MIPTGVGAEVIVPVGDGEIGALVAMGVVGEAVPCNGKGSTLGKYKLNGNNMGAQIVAHLCICIASIKVGEIRIHYGTSSNSIYL